MLEKKLFEQVRPEVISKMASFLQDKEPLVYLFIINSDFVNDAENLLLKNGCLAAVTIIDRRIKFYYDKRLLEMSAENLYFVILHEAFHIFKKHLEVLEDIFKEDHKLTNISADSIINEELNEMKFSYVLKPKMYPGACVIPENFKQEFRHLENKAFTTRRLYNWYKKNKKKFEKSDLLKMGSYCKNKTTGEYGKISDVFDKKGTSSGENEYDIIPYTKEEILSEMIGKNANNKTKKHNLQPESNLVPVITESNFEAKFSDDPGAVEVEILSDIIDDIENEKVENELEEKAQNQVFLEKMIDKAKEMDKVAKAGGHGTGQFLTKIEELLNPKVDWKKVLKNHLNLYKSNNSMLTSKKESFVTYPWNPKSRYDILYKHFIEVRNKLQTYIVLAIDTSGSVFYDPKELSIFMSEIEGIAKWLRFSKTGEILTIMWDYEVKEGLKLYQHNSWKNFDFKGGGGTNPVSIFQYLKEAYVERGNNYVVKADKKSFVIHDKKKLPFVIVLTDGYFYGRINSKNLGIYENQINNTLFFVRNENYMSKDIPRIIYE